MDHYKVLGLSKTATKDQIKQAFRKLALQFHPDKHSLSPRSVRDDATRRFKQASEAYDVLIDDRKRAHFDRVSDFGSFRHGGRSNSTNTGFGSYGYGGSRSRENYKGQYSSLSRFEVFFRYMGTRSFLINLVFAGHRGRFIPTNSGFSSYGYGGSQSRQNYKGRNYHAKGSSVSRFEVFFWYLGTRAFLINLVFAGVLLGGSYVVNSSGEALWKMRNSGKSFEEVMETREKAKAVKDEKT